MKIRRRRKNKTNIMMEGGIGRENGVKKEEANETKKNKR